MRSLVGIRERADQAHADETAAHAAKLAAIDELDETKAWFGDGAGNLESWLAARWQISRRDAARLVREARALKARPALLDALSSARISVEQCRTLIKLTAEGTDDAERWLEVLPFWSYTELEREARKATARELDRRDDGVFLRMEHTPDERYMRGEFQLHPEDGAAVLNAIESRIPEGTLLRDWDQASARALIELTTSPEGAPRRPNVLMSVPIEVLEQRVGSDTVAALSSGGFVGAETAQRLACDAAVQIVYRDDDGKVIAIEKSSHYIAPSVRRGVESRDGGQCVFPGCEADKYLDCHHIIPVEAGGPSVMDNLVTVCWRHHQLAHEGGWSLSGEAGPNITWIKPDGTPFLPRARIVLDTSSDGSPTLPDGGPRARVAWRVWRSQDREDRQELGDAARHRNT